MCGAWVLCLCECVSNTFIYLLTYCRYIPFARFPYNGFEWLQHHPNRSNFAQKLLIHEDKFQNIIFKPFESFVSTKNTASDAAAKHRQQNDDYAIRTDITSNYMQCICVVISEPKSGNPLFDNDRLNFCVEIWKWKIVRLTYTHTRLGDFRRKTTRNDKVDEHNWHHRPHEHTATHIHTRKAYAINLRNIEMKYRRTKQTTSRFKCHSFVSNVVKFYHPMSSSHHSSVRSVRACCDRNARWLYWTCRMC